MPTRSVHVVRIKDKSNAQNWIDVKVIDKQSYRGPNGVDDLLDVTAKKSAPYIKDETGHNNGKGDPGSCTRVSHMVTVTKGGMTFDAEYLDAVVFRGPNGQERLLYCPEKESHAAVIDKTDGNLAVPADSRTTRQCHIARISKDEDKDNPKALYAERVDMIAYDGVGGKQNLLFGPGDGDETDTTKYGDNKTPPDNTDPNIYVAWGASGASKGSAGPWVGASNPIKMGPLWWIVKAHGGSDLLLLIEVLGAGTGTPWSVLLDGLPFLTGAGVNIAIGASGASLVYTDGASGSDGISITDQPTQPMLDHLYLWSTPFQEAILIPPLPGSATPPGWSRDNFIVLNLSAITRDFPVVLDGASGASGASGATTWNAKFTVTVPDLVPSPAVADGEQFYVVWEMTNPDFTGPYDIITNPGVAPPWIAVFYPTHPEYPTMTNFQIGQMVQGFAPPFGIPDALPVRLFGDETNGDSLATYLEGLSGGTTFVDSGFFQSGDQGGGLVARTLATGVFENVFLDGASGQPSYGFDFEGEFPGPFAAQNFLNNEFFQWWYNGSSGATGIPDPFTPGATPVDVQPDYPPIQTYFPPGATGPLHQQGGTGIGPISAQRFPHSSGTEFSIGTSLTGYVATVFVDFNGASGASGATGFLPSTIITMSRA